MKNLIGKANHVYDDGSMSVIDVQTIEPDDEKINSWVSISPDMGDSFITINSKEQWKQLKALVDIALDGLE